MALLSAYATAAQFRLRVGSKAAASDADLDAQLLLCSRLVERSLQVMVGAFNSHTATYTFDARGGALLSLRDRAGRGYFLQAINADGLGIDSELDGTYDGYVLDLNDAWLRGLPESAVAGSEPYSMLELLGHLSSASPSRWLDQPANVRIAGTWGWAAVPGAILELTVSIVHDLRQAHLGGATLEVPALDGGGFPMRDDSWRLWREVKALYGRRAPTLA